MYLSTSPQHYNLIILCILPPAWDGPQLFRPRLLIAYRMVLLNNTNDYFDLLCIEYNMSLQTNVRSISYFLTI